MGTRRALALVVGIVLASSCQPQARKAAATKETAPPPAPLRLAGVGFVAPESVLPDTDVDLYLVSNVNGAPVKLPDGRWAISSWESKTVYAGPLEGPFAPLLTDVPGPADIGVDAKRNRLLVPLFINDEVLIQPLAP
jgi:hypothetical protein